MPVHAAPSSTTLQGSARHFGRTAVVTIPRADHRSDAIPSGAIVEAALRTVESVLSVRPRAIVADLSHVELSHFTIGLLSLVRRRTARVGIPLVLAGVSPDGQELLDRARVAPLYATYPTVPIALGALGAVRLTPRLGPGGRRGARSAQYA